MNDDDRDARIEAVAFAISDVADEREMFTQPLDPHDIQAIAGVAIAAYNAYLRERAQDADVVKAGARRFQDMLVEWENDAMNKSVTNDPGTDSNAYELANATITAALDVLLGKENDDDR